MAVGGDEAAVEAHVSCRSCGNHGQLGGEEIVLADAVFFVEQAQNSELDAVSALVVLQRLAAQQHPEVFAGNALSQRLLHLVAGQMDQQVRNAENGIGGILAHGDLDHGAVLLGHDAVKSQGRRRPLVLLDAAVIVGLEVGHFAVLIEGIGLQVQTGGVDVGGADVSALVQRLRADDGEDHAFAVAVAVDLVAGLQLHTRHQRLEAVLFCLGNGPVHRLALDLAVADKAHILPAIGLHGLQILGGNAVIAVLGCGEQRLAQGFIFLFFHKV